MKNIRRLLADRGGAAALEFALVGMPFVLLLLGLIEFGRGLHIRSALDTAADRAQRVVLINPSASVATLEDAIRASFQAGQPQRLVVSFGTDTLAGTDYRVVSLSYEMHLLLPAPLGRTLHIGSSRRVAMLD